MLACMPLDNATWSDQTLESRSVCCSCLSSHHYSQYSYIVEGFPSCGHFANILFICELKKTLWTMGCLCILFANSSCMACFSLYHFFPIHGGMAIWGMLNPWSHRELNLNNISMLPPPTLHNLSWAMILYFANMTNTDEMRHVLLCMALGSITTMLSFLFCECSFVSAGSRQLQGKMRKIQAHDDDDDDEEHPVTSVFQALLKKVWLDFYQLLNSDYWWSQLSSFCKDKAWNECWSLCSGNYVADWPMQRPFWSWKACLCGCMHTDAAIAAS